MADKGVVVEQGAIPGQSPLVEVTFQRNTQRKRKYLEAEPKALGITQICLSVYRIVGAGVFWTEDLFLFLDIALLILCGLVMIAGSLAIHAKNLHLSTLKACLGMQIMACASSVINMIFTIIELGQSPSCWYYRYYDEDNNQSFTKQEVCQQVTSIHSHFYAGGILIHAALVAISATLAAYCCKVVNCCGPASRMPVVTVHTQPDQQREA